MDNNNNSPLPTTPHRSRNLPPVPPRSGGNGPSIYSPNRQQYHMEEMANPYSRPGSPQRPSPQRPSPQRADLQNSPSVHGSPRNSPSRFPQRAEWTRLESSMGDHTPIEIDDDDDEIPSISQIPVPPQPVFSNKSYRKYPPPVVESIVDEDEMRFSNSRMQAQPVGGNQGVRNFHNIGRNTSYPETAPERAESVVEDYAYSEEIDDDDDENEDDDDENDDDDDDDDIEDAESNRSQETLSVEMFEAPEKAQPRRHKSMTRKEVKLVRGNLVLDCPVPTKLYSFLPRRDRDEFVYMRYTACTSDPDQFSSSGFTLRPAIYEREIQLCICVTMYNEDEVSFSRTMHAVMKNIAQLCSRNKSRVWGKEGWKKVVVTIVSDGRAKVNARVLDVLAAMGVYQEGIAKNYVNGEEVQAHIFEYTTQLSLDPEMKFQGAESGIVPVQMLFCLKEKNQKKINSHRWLFNAFCPLLNPTVCILLDVGTKPGNSTIYHLWKAFDTDSNVAGACGEIKAMLGPMGRNLFNPLIAAQNFEYKMSNVLDKPLESAFGYISVLPGALSAYRYRALKNNPDGTGPLNSYFKGETLQGNNTDVFTSNMYLAEDRILCWELVAKKSEKWVLKYVRAASGETDVPDSVAEFISQRRRWLNGSLFAAIYSLTHFRQIWKTDHSFTRKFFLHVEFIYHLASLVFTFFSLANFFLTFYFIAGSVASGTPAAIPHNGGLYLFLIFKYTCICSIAAQFILSLGNRPQGSKTLFTVSIALLSIVSCYAIGCGIYFVVKTVQDAGNQVEIGNNSFTTIIVSLSSTYGIYTLMSILYMDPWHMVTSFGQYFLLMPLYLCTLQIYAFCNTHDVTWGTKGDNEQKMDLGAAVVKKEAGKDIVEIEMPSEQLDIDSGYEDALINLREKKKVPEDSPSALILAQDYYREIRTRVVLIWMVANTILALIMTQIFPIDDANHNVYLRVILWSVAALAAFRALGSMTYLMQSMIKYLSESKNRTVTRYAVTGK